MLGDIMSHINREHHRCFGFFIKLNMRRVHILSILLARDSFGHGLSVVTVFLLSCHIVCLFTDSELNIIPVLPAMLFRRSIFIPHDHAAILPTLPHRHVVPRCDRSYKTLHSLCPPRGRIHVYKSILSFSHKQVISL